MTSSSTGVVNLIADSGKGKVRKSLVAPSGSVIMFSVRDLAWGCAQEFEMYSQDQNNSDVLLWKGCDLQYAKRYVLETNSITLQWAKLQCFSQPLCTEVYFSFHPKNKVPERLSNGKYNCSVDYYWRFQQHLDCNLQVECEDGRDEAGHCPFSSPACDGWVASRSKCYGYVSSDNLDRSVRNEQSTYKKAVKFCASLNASVATFKTSDDIAAITTAVSRYLQVPKKLKEVFLGVSYGMFSVPNIYRRVFVASDKSVIHYTLPKFVRFSYKGEAICFILKHKDDFRGFDIKQLACFSDAFIHLKSHVFCEITAETSDQSHKQIILSSKASFYSFLSGNISFSRCPNGQMVHMFLSCYPHFVCGQKLSQACPFSSKLDTSKDSSTGTHELFSPLPVFTCSDGLTRLSYTLVCDFRHHCKDWSDETFCHHPPCDAYACRNGQCIPNIKRCDLLSDCLDDSDELYCKDYAYISISLNEARSPALISFDRQQHSFQLKSMNSTETCPETHYHCLGEYNDCIPVFTRCNGYYDCIDNEDERDCKHMACPGFYRCFNSTVCVHTDHMCDGWPHCPQHDDEWLCDVTCPTQCLCEGHAFLCSNPFSANRFPHLRFLDAGESGMTPSDLSGASYLIFLSLSKCSLNFLPGMTFPNLQFLDLSANNLTVVSMAAFADVGNLRSLFLSNNPIEVIHYDPHVVVQRSALKTVDLSHTKLSVFDSRLLSNMINVQVLNLSFSSIHTIRDTGFQYTTKLTHLFMAGNPISTFSADLFKPLTSLRVLSSLSYKLCCREILPSHFEIISCDSPSDEISSCEDLLQSGIYRGFLWLISFLSVLGNVLCLVVRVCVQRTASTSGFNVFVTNLSSADLLMGVYLAIIGIADSSLRGKYLFYDETWKHSVACKVAGFLSMLSCEVSALIIWLITLDRFIVLHFPFTTLRFQRSQAALVCLITWLVGLSLALVPLLPVTSHWEFFSQTGICIPLPVTRQTFRGKAFSSGVFIVFNCFLFVLIATGQAFIYWSIQKNAFNTDSAKASRDQTIARRLISVAVTDFLCWFPIGICGLLVLADIPIPGEVNVAFAIFALPLNSALNPFMYTFNMVMEKRRQSREALLLQWLESSSELFQ